MVKFGIARGRSDFKLRSHESRRNNNTRYSSQRPGIITTFAGRYTADVSPDTPATECVNKLNEPTKIKYCYEMISSGTTLYKYAARIKEITVNNMTTS